MLYTAQLRKAKSSLDYRCYFALSCTLITCLKVSLPFVAPPEVAGASPQPTPNYNKILSHYPLFAPAVPHRLGLCPALQRAPLCEQQTFSYPLGVTRLNIVSEQCCLSYQ